LARRCAVGHGARFAAPLKLTLHDAVVLALRQNPQVILANLNVAQSTAGQPRRALGPVAAGGRWELARRCSG
jgi:hypothetical protein